MLDRCNCPPGMCGVCNSRWWAEHRSEFHREQLDYVLWKVGRAHREKLMQPDKPHKARPWSKPERQEHREGYPG